jgi:hypothetical protein
VNELYGDFRELRGRSGNWKFTFICFEVNGGTAGRVVLDKVLRRETTLTRKTPDAIMAA